MEQNTIQSKEYNKREKGRDLTQSYDKSAYTHRKTQKRHQIFDYRSLIIVPSRIRQPFTWARFQVDGSTFCTLVDVARYFDILFLTLDVCVRLIFYDLSTFIACWSWTSERRIVYKLLICVLLILDVMWKGKVWSVNRLTVLGVGWLK